MPVAVCLPMTLVKLI